MALSISDLARATGTKVETIRYYERIGLLPAPARTGGGQRTYAPDHLRRLAFVRRARDLGFGLDQARALLDLAHQPDRDCAAVDAVARVHLAEVDTSRKWTASWPTSPPSAADWPTSWTGAATGGSRSAGSSAPSYQNTHRPALPRVTRPLRPEPFMSI